LICDAKPINGNRCAADRPCGLRTLWSDLKDHVDIFLRRYNLEELSRMPSFTFSETAPEFSEHSPIQIRSGRNVSSSY
jgi:hypothetical protein